MRHNLLARPVAAGALGMGEAAAPGPLVARAGLPLRQAPGPLRAAAATVNLAPVTAPANPHRGSAATAQELPPGLFFHRRSYPAAERALDATENECKTDLCTRVQHGVGRGGESLARWGRRRARFSSAWPDYVGNGAVLAQRTHCFPHRPVRSPANASVTLTPVRQQPPRRKTPAQPPRQISPVPDSRLQGRTSALHQVQAHATTQLQAQIQRRGERHRRAR